MDTFCHWWLINLLVGIWSFWLAHIVEHLQAPWFVIIFCYPWICCYKPSIKHFWLGAGGVQAKDVPKMQIPTLRTNPTPVVRHVIMLNLMARYNTTSYSLKVAWSCCWNWTYHAWWCERQSKRGTLWLSVNWLHESNCFLLHMHVTFCNP